MIGLYLFGILMGIGTAFVFRKTLFKGEPVPFCHGAAKLSDAGGTKCRTLAVG